jgi:hypothetical protein
MTGDDGACLRGAASGAKVGIGKIFTGTGLLASLAQVGTLLRQSELARLVVGFQELRLTPAQVMRPSQLAEVQARVDAFNLHIRGWATRKGWPVMELGDLFRDRTSDEAKTSLTKLNGLFTGTLRPAPLDGEMIRRGLGNTMMCWDGVHPNSAGYSLAANQAIQSLKAKLGTTDFGGLEKGAAIDPVPNEMIRSFLVDNYLKLPRTRIHGWQLSTVE